MRQTACSARWVPCAEVLADQRGRGVAESPGGKNDEDDDADGDGIAGQGGRAEDADDADQPDPAGVGDGELQDAGERNAEQAEHHARVQANRRGGMRMRSVPFMRR